MLSRILIGASVLILVELPISASADMCDGPFSWLCGSEPASLSAPAAQPVHSSEAAWAPQAGAEMVQTCLSREQVRDGYPRYRTINGRRCWFASTDSRQPKRSEPNRTADSARLHQHQKVAEAERAHCELQALKLDEPDKTIFLKQCTSGGVR